MVDRSGWPIGKVLNMKSKGDFVTHMLVEELVGKRLQLLQSFREGLDYLGFVGMIKENPSLWEPLFVTKEPVPLSADAFISLFECPSIWEELQARAYALFREFVKGHEECTGKFCSSKNISLMKTCNRLSRDYDNYNDMIICVQLL